MDVYADCGGKRCQPSSRRTPPTLPAADPASLRERAGRVRNSIGEMDALTGTSLAKRLALAGMFNS